ncbi:MAG TPA: TonB-dependent receptor [Albitalea sp.]|nr:TonB-dependent receptor [Albitalea sp.]
MKNVRGELRVGRSLLSSAVLAALATMAQAQTAAPAPAASAASAPVGAKPAVEKLEAVVVTGTARSGGLKKLDASFSITTADDEKIKDSAPMSSADLLKIVPGVMVETTGGQTGNNIEIRGFAATGDAPWVTFQLNGAVMYPVPTMSFFEASSMFRLDDTIDRVEVLRGGPSPIFGDGQPGATVNFLMKKGGETPEGSIRVTAGTGNLRRVDGFYSSKIAEGWYASFGGFYRTSEGIRNTQFPSDRGGQFSAMLTRKLDEGELSIYGRRVNDKNQFFLPIPLVSSNNGHTLTSFPGFPAQTGTFIGNELRQVAFESSPGATPGVTKIDMADGRGADVRLYGLNLDKKLGDWQISDKANYLSGTMPTYAWFTGANPMTVDAYIAANLNGSTGGSASYVNNGGGALPGNTQIMSVGAWSVVKKLQSFTNDLRVSRDLTKDNTLTVGAWLADYSMSENWSLGNNFLTTLTPSGGRIVDITLTDNPAGDKVLSRNGQVSGAFAVQNNDFNGQNLAVFVADEWRATDKLRVDAGIRFEHRHASGTWENSGPQDLDANPNTLYNNGVAVLNGTHSSLDISEHKSAYTAGVNYYLTPQVSVFGRINSGYQFQHFNNIRGATGKALEPATVKQYELGLKTKTDLYSAYLTGFYNKFSGLNFLTILATGPVTQNAGSSSKGIEAEVSIKPFAGFELAATGNYLKAHYTDYDVAPGDNRTGNQVIRQPKLQFRLTPSYQFATALGSVKAFATYSYIGVRFSDTQNTQILPKYHTLDAGVVAHLNNGIDLRLTGTNLTNTIGITEGNTRVLGAATTDGVFLGRPIFGRAFELSVGFNF